MKTTDGIEVVQVALRLPREMKKQIVDAAWGNRRSTNAEILCRLEDSLGTERRADVTFPETHEAAA